MSQSDKFCLKWDEFNANTSSCFSDLREDIDFTDVTLSCEDNKSVEAHKVILSASSPIMKQILKQNKHPHPLIYMKGIKAKDLSFIIDFIYHGEVNIYQQDLPSFLTIAEELQIKGLDSKIDIEKDMNNEMNSKYNITDDIGTLENEKESKLFKSDKLSENSQVTNLSKDNTNIIPASDHTLSLDELDTKINTMMHKLDGIWTCKVCGKNTGLKKDNMRNHIEAMHIEGAYHECNQCGKSFRTRIQRACHISKKHR